MYEGGFESQFADCLTERIGSLDKDIEIMCSYHYQVVIGSYHYLSSTSSSISAYQLPLSVAFFLCPRAVLLSEIGDN